MAGYFTVDVSFWTDSDVTENFTPEDKYFYLYLLTCPYANISGCYENSLKQMAYDTGYSRETVERLIDRFVNVHKVIDYSSENKEILVCNWGKYHWTTSSKYITALKRRIEDIKTKKFRDYLTNSLKIFQENGGKRTEWIPYQYGMHTSSSVTSSFTYTSPDKEIEIGVQGEEEEQEDLVMVKKGEDYISQAKEVLSFWNSQDFLPEVKKCSPSSERGKMLIARIKEYGTDDVLKAVKLAGESKFLLEQNWFGLEWFVKPNNFVKVLEGKYNRDGIRENQRGGYAVGNRQNTEHSTNFGRIRPSFDPDDYADSC